MSEQAITLTGKNIDRARWAALRRGLKLEIKTGMSMGRRTASAILKSHFGWPKNLSKKDTLRRFEKWCFDNGVEPYFHDMVYQYTDGLTGEKDWRYIRRGESGYYPWTPAFTVEVGKSAQQLFDELREMGLTDEIIADMEEQSMFGWRTEEMGEEL